MAAAKRANIIAALVAAALASGVGIAINLATASQSSLWAWAAVVALTLLTAGWSAYTFRRDEPPAQSFGSTQSVTNTRLMSTTSSVVSSGLVMRTVRVKPDGTRLEMEFFNEEIALKYIREDEEPSGGK